MSILVLFCRPGYVVANLQHLQMPRGAQVACFRL